MPKISIIVPVYNVEKYLEKCIDSILNQSFRDFELILVDDGSTDNSGYICDRYKNQDDRIIVIHKENGGLSSARNAGIDISKGDFIGFVDSDDFIHRDMYKILYNNIIKSEADLVICKEQNIYEDEYVELNSIVNERNLNMEELTSEEAIKKLYKVRTTFVYAWNKLYKRDLFKELRYPENKIYEDEWLSPKLLYKSSKIVYINYSLYYYLQRKGSIVKSQFRVEKFDKVYALEDNVRFFKSNKEKKLHEISTRVYLDTLLWTDKAALNELENVDQSISKLRQTINNHIIDIMKNPMFSYKQKILLLCYRFNPNFYYKIVSKI